MKKSMKRMLDEIEREAEYTRSLTGRKRFSSRVMAAMGKVPREQFVPTDLRVYAFDNGPLPIGYGQTISQPYIVALMTDLLELQADHSVLEIGTGSGYQTAILSLLASQVYTIEVVQELGEASARCLQELGYTNISFRIGNGCAGWPEHAPYDAIIVTAAAAQVPQPLIDQLTPGGRLVIPVGLPYMPQELLLVKKDLQGEIHTRDILSVAFVPLTGGEP
ncbi:MAG: protein-L-isoaspartate(D-aspartate) O-methyltransferase [Gammaproteobacteria bacterium]|nr:MAG: protein-L-isoaspartate(D-aspartate) O-methyltransferase [Gammaproteobacteria bacterium]